MRPVIRNRRGNLLLMVLYVFIILLCELVIVCALCVCEGSVCNVCVQCVHFVCVVSIVRCTRGRISRPQNLDNFSDIFFFIFKLFIHGKASEQLFLMRQKGIDLNHDFSVVVGKQCRTENAYTGHQHNIFI